MIDPNSPRPGETRRRDRLVPAILTQHSYGKSLIRLTKVTRGADCHHVRELTIEIQLEGEFADSYTLGDNRLVIPTDTMKNVAYALAQEHPLESIEDFGAALTARFLENYVHVATATVRLGEQPLRHIWVAEHRHPHAFFRQPGCTRTSTVRRWRGGVSVQSGIDDLFLLKTTDSSFTGFLRDRYTTLAEATDRIFATLLRADWLYDGADVCWDHEHELIRRTLVETFAVHQSLSVQQTLYAMGAAALEACARLQEISLVMPNKHRILVDLKPFGLENRNEIFVATDEPQGVISGTLRRAPASAR
jgi:urate oxidase